MFQCTQVDRYILIHCMYLHFGIYMLYILNEHNQHINISGDISLHVQSRPPYSTLLLQSQVHVALCSTPPFLQLKTHGTIVYIEIAYDKNVNKFCSDILLWMQFVQKKQMEIYLTSWFKHMNFKILL